jgi:SAM-dependent methyltransferase
MDNKPIYRTDAQAQVILDMFPLKPAAKILDYGAAKGATLRKIASKRSDISPYIFDVSEDYRNSWAAWLPTNSCATYELNTAWKGRFDLITAHYVLEHVPQAVASLMNLKSFLAPDGAIFFSVPDWESNPGDLLVADHVNHFTATSIRRAVREAALKVKRIERTVLPAAFAVLCEPAGIEPNPRQRDIEATVAIGADCAAGLSRACARLDEKFAANRDRKSAIFGGGFYGAFLFARASAKVPISCFLDNNPHLWSEKFFGLSVLPPKFMPDDIDVVYVGLNPNRAREIVKEIPMLQRAGLELVFLDTQP